LPQGGYPIPPAELVVGPFGGEFDGEVIDEEQLKKVEERCHSLGVELEYMKDGIATLRNPIEVLKDLAEVYNSLPDDSAEKQGLISDLGGKYHANALSALLSRWDLYEKMLSEFSQGAGSSLEEAEKTANSWEGRLNSLQNSWDSFINTLTNKEAVMGGISFFDRLIQGAEKLIDTIGEIPVVLTTLNTAMVAMKKDYGITQLVNSETKKLDIQGNVLGIDFSAIKEQKKHFEEASKAISGWNNKLSQGQTDINDFENSLVQNNAQLKGYLSICSKDAPASLAGYKASLNAAGISTDVLRLKTILLNSAISLGIGAAIQVAVQGITYLIQREEELRQATQEAANAYKESASSIEDYASRYEELHKALIAAKGNEEETYNIKQQLLALQTELNGKFGEECETLDLVTNAYESQAGAIRNLNKEKARLFLNENKEGIDKAEKEMTKEDRHYNLSLTGVSAYTDKGAALKEIAEKYADQGVTLLDELGDGSYAQFSVHLDTDAQSAYDTINAFENDLRDKAKELGDEHMFEDVLDMSSDSLNKAKETIENYGDTYKQALVAEIVSDDDKSKAYGEALNAVEAYNEAVLRSENPYDDKNVTQAKENLDAVKASIQGNEEEWGKYSVLLDDVFGQADTRLLEFNEALKTDDGLKGLANDLDGLSYIDLQALDENVGKNNSFDKLKKAAEEYDISAGELIDTLVRLGYVQGEIHGSTSNENPISFDQAWADSFTSENEKVRELVDTLFELAEQGRLTKETFNEADSTDYFKNLNISADEAVSKINRLVDESKQLSSMSSQISSMANALGTKQENGFVEADTLSGFDVEVRGLESWDRFQEVLGSTTSSYEECQEAANALATEWVNSSDFLAQLTEQNREYYATQLEAMGIENYEEVISYAYALNEAKEVLMQSSLELGEATQDEIEALIAEGTYSELTANMILALYDAKIAEQAATLDTSADCANLIALAGDADRTSQSIQLLIQLMEIYSGLESGVYDKNEFARTGALAAVTGIKAQLEAIANGETAKMEIEPTVKLGNRGKSSAKSAGKEAGKSYKDGLKEELSDIESIISSLSKSIDGQKEVITSQKEVALESIESQIDALEEERDARLAVIDAQKKQLEEQIKAIEKQIKAKNDEIKAINDAATARQHEIDLQKAQYELERMQNQRTMLQYSEDKGMHYVADESGIRDAKESVDDAKRQLDIDAIEKEIDLLEESKDLLNEQIDLLEEQADNINKFYDSQIKALEKQKESTEKYFESLIKSIENSKSKYEELLELVDKAELSGKLKKLGIDEEALLAGSEEEFEKLKNAYLDVVFQVNEGNEEMLSSLRELSGYEGTAPAVLTDTSEKLGDIDTKLDGASESMESLASSATTASEGASSIAASMSELGTSTEGISENLTSINDALTGLPEAENINAVSDAFTNMGEAIKSVADALGVGEEGTVGGLVGALQSLSEISLGEMGGEGQGGGTGIVSQFQALKTAVDDVTNAISGGGSSGSTGGGDASNSSSSSMSAGAGDGEGASGLISAIGEIKPATDEALGGGGEEGESEGEGSGAIPQFQELKTAVDDVTAAIGTADSEGGEGTGEGAESTTLIGALRAQYETASETIPETKALFEELLESIMSCVSALNTMVGMMGSMAEIGGGFGGSAISVTPNAKGTVGNAFANGTGKYKGLANREKNALVSEYGQTEMTVLPNGKTILTDKPTLMDLPKDTVIFNEEQTKKIMDSKVDVSGNAYASGTDNGSVPYQPTGELAALMDFCKQNVKSILKSEQEIALTVHEMQKQINNGIMSGINSVTNTAINNISNNNKPSVVIGDINVTCPGVTSQQVAEQLGGVLGKELDKQFNGFNNYVDQQSRIR